MNLKDCKIIKGVISGNYDDAFKIYVDDTNLESCINIINENIVIQQKNKYYFFKNVSYDSKAKVWAVDKTYAVIFKYDYVYNFKEVTLQMNRIRKTEKLLNNG